MKKVYFITLITFISLTSLFAKDSPYYFDSNESDKCAFIVMDKPSEKIVLTRIDDQYPKDRSYFSREKDLGINIAISRKQHHFEFIDLVQKRNLIISFELLPNQVYTFFYNGSLTIKNQDQLIDYEIISDNKKYSEPDEKSKYAVIIADAITQKEGRFSIKRIDSLPGDQIIKGFGRDLFIAFAKDNYAIKISPGEHSISYITSYKDYLAVNTITKRFIFEEGKKYKIRIKDIDSIKKDNALVETEIVEY